MTFEYSREYYASFLESGRRSAEAIVPLLMERYRPQSVLDVGSGMGYFLDTFRSLGVQDTWAVDSPSNDGGAIRQGGHVFVQMDLTRKDLALDRKFDLALCLEVAEHLAEDRGPGLVAGLIASARVVAFSAAIPWQEGEGHVNLRPQSYWVEQFASHGYGADDFIRRAIWDDANISWWYRQNLLVYAAGADTPEFLPDVVHPALLEETYNRHISGREGLAALVAALQGRLRPARAESDQR